MTQVAKTPPTNGAAKPPAMVAVTTPAQEPKKAEKPGTKVQGDDLPPLEDRLHRLGQLFHLQQKYSKLQESLQKLNSFDVKKDGESAGLRLNDDSRNEFTTYHPEVVQEVVDFLKEKIKLKIKQLEPQLKW